MQSREPRPPATLADVKDQATRVGRDIATLHSEVNRLANLVRGSHKGAQLEAVRWESGWSQPDGTSTLAPKSPITRALYDVENVDSIEALSQVLKAMAKGLDGALIDVRAARLNIESIVEDEGARTAFRTNRGRRR